MRKITVFLLAASVVATLSAPSATAAPAAKKSPPKATKPKPLLGGVMFPKLSLGAKIPVAIVLEPKGKLAEAFVLKWRRDLTDAGFCSIQTNAPAGGWKASHADILIKEFDKLPTIGKLNPNRILIVAPRDAGAAAIATIEKYHARIAGAIMISVSPWVHKDETIKLWRPSKKAWSVPLWATIPVNITGGAPTLLLWRRIASGKPKDASLTIDPRLNKGDTHPDKTVAAWISAIASGKRPAPGPDQQMIRETQRYRESAKQLLAAMQVAKPADAGPTLTKTEGPMALSVTPPDKWRRVERGERKYDALERPYVQIYVTPQPGGMLFARANAAKWDAGAPALLDQYEQRLAEGGYLAVRHSRWRARGYSLQISSILWPTRGKWHRWLVLVAAGAGSKNAPAAPMVTVMDASDIPDVNAMSAAMKRMLSGVKVAWKGEAKPKPAGR